MYPICGSCFVSASVADEALREHAKAERLRNREDREAEKKKALEKAMRTRWAELQRLSRHIHDGYACKFRSIIQTGRNRSDSCKTSKIALFRLIRVYFRPHPSGKSSVANA